MAWVADSILQLYRDMNASLVSLARVAVDLPFVLRRIQKELDEMAKTNKEVIEIVRRTQGFVASLVASQEELRKQVAEALSDNDVDDEVVEEVDKLFSMAKDGATSLAPAIVANPTPADPIPQPTE